MSEEIPFTHPDVVRGYDDLRTMFPELKESPPRAARMVPLYERKVARIEDLDGYQVYVQAPPVPEGFATWMRNFRHPEQSNRPPDGSFDLFKLTRTAEVRTVAQYLIDHPDDVPEKVTKWLGFCEGPLMETEGGSVVPVVLTMPRIIRGRRVHHLSGGNITLGSPDLIELKMREIRGEEVGTVLGYIGTPKLVPFLLSNLGIMFQMKLMGRGEELEMLMRERGWE